MKLFVKLIQFLLSVGKKTPYFPSLRACLPAKAGNSLSRFSGKQSVMFVIQQIEITFGELHFVMVAALRSQRRSEEFSCWLTNRFKN